MEHFFSQNSLKPRKPRLNLNQKEDTVVFFVRLSSICWAINDNVIWELVENLMSQNRHKLLYYRRGLKGINTVVN